MSKPNKLSAPQPRYVDPATLKHHPVADWFDNMPEEHYQEFKADIKKHGQRDAIVVKDNFILDGKHRARACRELGRGVKCVEYQGEGGNELDFVISANLHRRHLTTSQRSIIAAKLTTEQRGGDRRSKDQSRKIGNGPKISEAQAAKQLNVSTDQVTKAKKVLREAPEKAKAIKEGKLTVGKAASELSDKKQKTEPRKGRSRESRKSLEIRVHDDCLKALKNYELGAETREAEAYLRKFLRLQLEDEELAARVWKSYRWLVRKYSASWKEVKSYLREFLQEGAAYE